MKASNFVMKIQFAYSCCILIHNSFCYYNNQNEVICNCKEGKQNFYETVYTASLKINKQEHRLVLRNLRIQKPSLSQNVRENKTDYWLDQVKELGAPKVTQG